MDDYRAEAKRRWQENQRSAGGGAAAEGGGGGGVSATKVDKQSAHGRKEGLETLESFLTTGGAAGSGSAGIAGSSEAASRSSEAAASPKGGAGGGASGSGSRAAGPRGASEQKAAASRNAGGASAQDGDFLGSLQARWASLSAEQQMQALALCGLVFAMFVMGSQSVPLLVAAALACYLSTRLPTTASFEPFFREWFTQEYFPLVSQKLQREFQERAEKERNLFDSLASKFKGWVVGQTQTLSALAMYEFVVKYSLPPDYDNWYLLRTATVNLGSRQRPSYLTFWGIHGTWMLAPYISVDVENTSILEELTRGAASAR